MAILQFFSLTFYPHLVFGAYGAPMPDHLAAQLTTQGVEMFIGYYGQAVPGRAP